MQGIDDPVETSSLKEIFCNLCQTRFETMQLLTSTDELESWSSVAGLSVEVSVVGSEVVVSVDGMSCGFERSKLLAHHMKQLILSLAVL